MKLCKDCQYAEPLGQYRVCLKLTPMEKIVQKDDPKLDWVLCINARAGECGPEAKYYRDKK